MLKSLKRTTEYKYQDPDPNVLDTFVNPGVETVDFKVKEFTSLCPITGQPDYAELTITIWPQAVCLESKSLKLYLMMFRQYGGFAEQISRKIAVDLGNKLQCPVVVKGSFASRGGIEIKAEVSYYGGVKKLEVGDVAMEPGIVREFKDHP